MNRFILIAFIITGLSSAQGGIVATREQMSGTSFNSTRTEQQGNALGPLMSLAARTALLGLGLTAVRRVVRFVR
jgi:hypothetical protein